MANSVLYGFAQLQDKYGDLVNNVGEEVVAAARALTVEKHNADINQMIQFFGGTTTDYKARFRTMSNARLQPTDEYGRPRKIKPTSYDVAYPLLMGATGDGATFVTAAKMTVGVAQTILATQLNADINWIRSELYAALFTNVTYDFVDEEFGTATIMPLANNDSQTYFKLNGSASTDNHYLAQANAISNTDNPYPGIVSELKEHQENTGDVISFIPTNQVSDTIKLASFLPIGDPNVRQSPLDDQLARTPLGNYPGKLLGYADGSYIVEWPFLPDNYIISKMTGGDDPVKFRQDKQASLNGLILMGREDAPYSERYFYRRGGFGVHNRVGAVVQRIGNGSYAIPTGYTAPLA